MVADNNTNDLAPSHSSKSWLHVVMKTKKGRKKAWRDTNTNLNKASRENPEANEWRASEGTVGHGRLAVGGGGAQELLALV
jgi:hypothetical protein